MNNKPELRKVVILGTGGTIAGVGEPGLTTGYFSGGLDIDSLITGVPGLKKLAWLVGEQIANVNSDDITQADWLKLANRINDMTNTMNSRAMNNYITVDGAADPNAFADDLIRSFRLNARTI